MVRASRALVYSPLMRATLCLCLLLSACDDDPGGDAPTRIDPSPDAASDAAALEPDAAAPEPDAEPGPPPFDWSEDWTALTDGVSVLELGGALPDMQVVHGERAFPLVLDAGHRPFVSAAHVGDGRVFHAAHESIITAPPGAPGDANRLLRNAVAWLAGPVAGTTVVAVHPDLRDGLTAALADTRGVSLRPLDLTALDDVDVVAVTTYIDLDGADLDRLHTFVEGGGGHLSAGLAWWWAQQTGADAATDFPGNLHLAPAGIVISGSPELVAGTVRVAGTPPGRECHASQALDLMLAFLDGARVPFDTQVTAATTVSRAIRVLPLTLDAYFDRARTFLDSSEPVVPTKAAPIVPAEQPVEQLVVALETKLAEDSPPDEVLAVRAASDFPGPVPDDAERVTRTVTIDGDNPGLAPEFRFSNPGARVRRGTGLYAAPGEVFTVVVPAGARGRVDVLIGAHSDRLWERDAWERFPSVVRSWPLESARNRVSSGFGGPISIRVPTGTFLGDFDVTIEGAVEMPRFVRGVTSADAWATARTAPAPWAELATDGIILTVPSSAVRDLDDPAPLLDFWQEVMDASARLAGLEGRPRAERFVLDRQISAGWMHSGYPIMGHLESTRDLVDLAFLRAEGSWGPFHEIGHNHQWIDWVLPGTIETSCNLWSVYVYEEVVGRHRDETHEAIRPEARAARMAAYLAGGADFGDWSVWVALETYLQLQEAFGWRLLTELFVEYRALRDVPRDDAQRIDTWVVRSSTHAGVNLGPFYVAWGLPVSQAALDVVAELPAWAEDPMAER